MQLRNAVAILLFSALVSTAEAELIITNFNTSALIPDGNVNGFQDTRTLSGLPQEITEVKVSLNISGGYNGDLYASLTHASGLVVLLNRVGRSSSDSFGYGDTGFLTTFSDSGSTNDVHLYQSFSPAFNGSGQLTGTWNPDGRQTNPLNVLDTDARTALLASFIGLDPNGSWTLLVSDWSGGDQSTLESWGLEVITADSPYKALTLAIQGVGTIIKVPDQPFYTNGQQVALNATAGRWHFFSNWTDGNTNNPRTVTIGQSNAYTAVFTPTTTLETVTIGSVSRLAPVGMPAVVVDGVFILTPSASARGSALVTLSTTFPGGWLFYTLDGSDPAASGLFYTGPFTVRQSATLRTIAYNSDFTLSIIGDPVDIIILPTLTALTDGGGSIAIEPPAGAYFSNGLATVTATAAPGWVFLQWLGDASGTNPVVSLSMTRNKTVRAVFGTTLNTTPVGGGSLVVSPASPWYPYGNPVRLTAVPATGNYLVFWANAAAGQTSNPLTFTITQSNQTVTAVFANLGGAESNALTVIANGRGQVTLTPQGNLFPLNANVVLQATPDASQDFLGCMARPTRSC